MIGHYLLQLSPEAEDRLLMGKLDWNGRTPGGGTYQLPGGAGCLRAVAELVQDEYPGNCGFSGLPRWPWVYVRLGPRYTLERRYDELCVRFGVPRVASAIRMRILANRAWRSPYSTRHVQGQSA